MAEYDVRAVRWAQGWELHVAGVGVTHCRTLEDAERHVRLFVETLHGVDASSDTVTIRVDLDGARPMPGAPSDPPERWQ